MPWKGRPIGLGHWSGANKTSVADDILYISVRRDGTTDTPGIYRITDLDGFFQNVQHIFKPDDILNLGSGGGDISSRADLTVDPAGNVILFENGNEEIILLAPPSSLPTVSFTTKSATTFTLGTTSVERIETESLPDQYVLFQNYPNPFNPTTTIEFEAPTAGNVRLVVYNIFGQEVAVLVDAFLGPGHYRTVFDARQYASGTYISVLTAGENVLKNRMILLK